MEQIRAVRYRRQKSKQRRPTPLFVVRMNWGRQPVRLTAWRRTTIPNDGPVTSVHIVAFHRERLLVVRDRKGVYGFPGGRLEEGESLEEALSREVYEEANAHIEPSYSLFGVLKIECTQKIPGRDYPHRYSYMAMYAGAIRALEPITRDPAGIIDARVLFTPQECKRYLQAHDLILLQEALTTLAARNTLMPAYLHVFLEHFRPEPPEGLPALRPSGMRPSP